MPFGVYYYGGNVESISVQTTGDWQLTFRPLTDLEPLPDFYEQQSPAPTTFFYDGPGGEIEVFAEEDDDPRWMRFTLTQNPLLELDTDITRIERTSTVSTYLDPGPSVIVVDPYATSIWSISTK